MSIRRKAVLAAVVLSAGFITWFLVLPMFQYSAARKKYPLGMTLEDAQKVARKPFRVLSAEGGVVYGPPKGPFTNKPPDHLKRTEVRTEMYCEEDGALLLFNYYDQLIEIRPIRSLVDIAIWKHTRRW